MDSAGLRELQGPLKEKYRNVPMRRSSRCERMEIWLRAQSHAKSRPGGR
jgi:hypothetical protein